MENQSRQERQTTPRILTKVYLSEEQKERLQEQSNINNKSISKYIADLIEKDLELNPRLDLDLNQKGR